MAQQLSGIFDNLLQSFKKSDQSEMDKSCYTLYIHYEETDDIDDITEPAAFQIPVDMKWKDLQDLILLEGGSPQKLNFIYYDDEQDEIRIDSQEEYETALHICRKEKRDLHIYKLDPSAKPKRRKKKKRRRSTEKKRPDDEFAVLPELEKPVVVPAPEEIQAAHFEFGQQERNENPEPDQSEPEPEPTFHSVEGAVGGEPSAPTQENIVASEENQETTPMPPGNSLINFIKKEIRQVVSEELDDVWRFVNALKGDINEELDVIGEQLASHSAQLPEVQKQIQNHLKSQAESASDAARSSESEPSSEAEEETEVHDFAATFICESLLDGSIVHTGETFQKHWVFRNDGATKWDENTKLHLLDEMCDPPVVSGSSLSEWGAKGKSVTVPPLKCGEAGVVCAEHIAPAHPCNYNSSWRMSHKNNPFGPRVWCNVRVEEESGTPVDNQTKSLESYVELESETQKISLEKTQQKTVSHNDDLHGSLVPAEKVEVEEKPAKPDDVHNDHTIMSFNMDDISDGARYIGTPKHESVPYNPAVTSVENQNQEEECLHALKTDEKEDIGASVDGEDRSTSSASPVLVTPPTEQIVAESNQTEEPQTLKKDDEPRTNETEESSDDEDLYSSKYVENPAPEEENHLENFTEQVVRTPDTEYSSDGEQQEEDEEAPEEPEPEEVNGHSTEDLHSVEYTLDDEPASMMSFASDFVVVPLPDCFDVNKPLNASQYEEKQEDPEPEPSKTLTDQPPAEVALTQTEEPVEEEEDPTPCYPPEEESDSEVESQPSSVARAKEYHSEDSIVSSAPKTPVIQASPAPSLTPKVNLAPTFVTPQNNLANEPGPSHPDSLDNDNESLTERITKEFNEFLDNPEHPINPPPKPKIPMNQIPSVRPKAPVLPPSPQPVPASVLNMDEPYRVPNAQNTPYYMPFEQGWRRNPIPVPSSVTNNDPWPQPQEKPTPAPRLPPQLPRSEFTLNQHSNGIQTTFPLQPFAVASPSDSIQMDDPFPDPPRRQRPPSPQIEIADDFYPPGLEAAGTNMAELYQDAEEAEIFRTPNPSPPPSFAAAGQVELSPLDQLYEMGFQNIELNKETFESCGHDLNRTVQALVLRAQADEEMMA